MRKLVLLGLLLVAHVSQAAWLQSFEDAKKMSLATNKFIVVDFWATWCGPCKKMDRDSWSHESVTRLLGEAFVSVKIDIDRERAMASQYGITVIPFVMIMDANGKVISKFEGYKNATELKRELDKFALSTEYLAMDLINYSKSPGYSTGTRLAQKYFDYALQTDKEIRSTLIVAAESYLSDSEKGIGKNDPDAAAKKEKLALLEICAIAYSGNLSKVEKKISKYKPDSLHESNQNYYYFLAYLVAKHNNSGVEDIEKRVAELNGFDYFKTRADLILQS